MAKNQLSQQDYDHLIDSFAQQLWFLRERWEGIKALRAGNQRFFTSVWTSYHRFLDSAYRSFVYDFYVGICRLVIDDNKDVESISKLLKKSGIKKPEIADKKRADQLTFEENELFSLIKNNITIKKIKNQRDYLLAHQNSNLLFDKESADQFRNENNPSPNEIDLLMDTVDEPSPNEIDLLMDTVDEVLTKMARRASFYPSTTPNTSIKREIEEIFFNLKQSLMGKSYMEA
jgi:HEPN superfamily AbiU2-like protein